MGERAKVGWKEGARESGREKGNWLRLPGDLLMDWSWHQQCNTYTGPKPHFSYNFSQNMRMLILLSLKWLPQTLSVFHGKFSKSS